MTGRTMRRWISRAGRGVRRAMAWGALGAVGLVAAGSAAASEASTASAAPARAENFEERLAELLAAPDRPARSAAEGGSGTRPAGAAPKTLGAAPLGWDPAAALAAHRDVAPGVDLAFAIEETRLDALWVVRPGADPASIRLDFPGAAGLTLGDDGALRVTTAATGGVVVTFGAPVVYQEDRPRSRERSPVGGAYRLAGPERVGVSVGEYDEARPLYVRVEAGAAGGPLPNSVPPTVTATLVDSQPTPPGAQPGDTIDYTAEIQATGMAATGVQADFSNAFDANVDLLPGTVLVTPVAADDGFDVIGNTPLAVSAPANGVLANDFDPDNPTPTLGTDLFVAPGSVTKIGGTVAGAGSLTISADGAFTYTPPLGETGTEVFQYSARDGDALDSVDPGVVTFTIADMVWYIDNSVAASGAGRASDPFKTLADFMAVQGGGAGKPAVGDFIRLRTGTSDYDSAGAASLSLLDDQKLVGQGVDLVVGTTTLETGGAGQEPTLTNTGGTPGDGIALASGNTIRGLDVGATPGAGITGTGIAGGTIDKVGITDSSAGGISLNNATGTFTFSSLDIDSTAGTPGTAFEISGGSASVTVNGDITQGLNASAVAIDGGHSGTVDFQSGTISATNGDGLQFDNADGTYSFSGTTTLNGGDAGIDILGNSNGTFTFDSLTSITNPTGGAFKLVGDGTSSPTVTYSGTIANNAGDAVSIQSTAAGNTITFDGAAADAIADGGAGTGIFLSSVGQDVNFTTDVELGGAEGIDVDGGTGIFTFADTDVSSPSSAAGIDVNGGSTSITFGADSSVAQGSAFPAVSISNGHSGAFTQMLNAAPAADAGTIAATSGTGLQFDNADGTYGFNGTVTLAGGDAGIDILNGSGGGFTFSSNSSITNPTGVGFRIDTSSGGDVTYAGTILQTSAASAVQVNAKTGGAATFSGAVTAATGSATGIDLAGNTGATITFSGGLDIDTTSGTGFSATGGGTLNVTGSNTVNTTETSGGAKDAGSAVVLSGMKLGDDDVTFATIGVAAGTAVGNPGIDVDSTTNAGTFFGGTVTIAGTGAGAAGIDVSGSSAAFDFTSATIDNTGGAGIKLSGANGAVTFDTVDVDGTVGHGIEISGNTNTVLIDAGTIGAVTTSGMDGVNIAGGSGEVTVDATIQQGGANNSVDVSGRAGGSATTFNGAIDDNGGGIRLAGNGGTIGFVGNLALDTGTSTAFSATGGGTVFATGTNTIGASAALSRRAVEITGTAIGASGVTFRSIDVDGGNTSAVPAIELADTSTGTFTITGIDGPCGNTMAMLDCDGGTLEKLRADAIVLKNTGGLVTLNNLRIQDIGDMTVAGVDHRSQHDAIHGEAVGGGLTLDDVVIRRVGDQGINGALFLDGVGETSWTNLTIQDSLIEDTNRFVNACSSSGSPCVDDLDEAAVRIFGIKGTVVVDNSKLQRGGELLTLFTDDVAGTLTVTVTRSEFRDAAKLFAFTPGAKGKACVNFSARGPMNANITLGDKTNAALANTFHDCAQASLVVAQDSSTGASGHVNLTVAKNTFEVDNHTSLFTGTPCGVGGFNFPQGGLAIKPSGSSSASLDALIQDNLLDELMHADGGFGQLTIVTDSGNTSQIKVKGNTFAKAFDQPWRIVADGASTSTILFEGNTHTSANVNVPECGGLVHTPFAPNTLNVRNGSVVDAVFKGEVMVQHDVANFGADEQFNATLQTSGASLCLDLDGNTNPNRSPDGYGLTCSGDCSLPVPRNVFNLEKSASDSGPCDACGSALLADVVSDNGNTGTGGTGTATPPFVNDSGAINIVSTACKEPSGSIF